MADHPFFVRILKRRADGKKVWLRDKELSENNLCRRRFRCAGCTSYFLTVSDACVPFQARLFLNAVF
ncbi:hypothetical protein D3Z50_14605 [Clostridiaceae bacterium]|nr:hypothetical protein [Clostridiaceae bacterium]